MLALQQSEAHPVKLNAEDYAAFVEWMLNNAGVTSDARWYIPHRCKECSRLVGLAAGPAPINLTLPFVVDAAVDADY